MPPDTEQNGNLPAIAFLAKSLGDENRLKILQLVCREAQSVSALVESLGLSQPLVSHHLRELKRALLVTVRRSGPFVYYRAADPRIFDILDRIDGLAVDLLSNRTTF